jgi:hypothetical protein
MTRLGVSRENAETAIKHVSGRSALETSYGRQHYALEVRAAPARLHDHVAELVRPEEGEDP